MRSRCCNRSSWAMRTVRPAAGEAIVQAERRYDFDGVCLERGKDNLAVGTQISARTRPYKGFFYFAKKLGLAIAGQAGDAVPFPIGKDE